MCLLKEIVDGQIDAGDGRVVVVEEGSPGCSACNRGTEVNQGVHVGRLMMEVDGDD